MTNTYDDGVFDELDDALYETADKHLDAADGVGKDFLGALPNTAEIADLGSVQAVDEVIDRLLDGAAGQSERTNWRGAALVSREGNGNPRPNGTVFVAVTVAVVDYAHYLGQMGGRSEQGNGCFTQQQGYIQP